MRTVVKLLAAFVLAIGTCCTSPSTANLSAELPTFAYEATPEAIAVGIRTPSGAVEGQRGTGVVIHSSLSLGTLIITNEHVVMAHPRWNPTPIPSTVYTVIFPNGDEVAAEYLISAAGKLGEQYYDVGILWIPPNDRIYPALAAFDDQTLEPGTKIYLETFVPHMRPERAYGTVVKTDFGVAVVTDPEVEPGNSGSGVYTMDNHFAGLIMSKSPDGYLNLIMSGEMIGQRRTVGFYTDSKMIAYIFRACDTYWALTPNISDDPKPVLPEGPK